MPCPFPLLFLIILPLQFLLIQHPLQPRSSLHLEGSYHISTSNSKLFSSFIFTFQIHNFPFRHCPPSLQLMKANRRKRYCNFQLPVSHIYISIQSHSHLSVHYPPFSIKYYIHSPIYSNISTLFLISKFYLNLSYITNFIVFLSNFLYLIIHILYFIFKYIKKILLNF